jgi:hypothetical protein
MKLTITDVILIILILGVLYLLYSPDIDHFTSDTEINDAINEEINNRYLVNLTNMRNLSGLITDITNNKDTINITQSNTKLFDININDININSYLSVANKTYFDSDVSIKGIVSPVVKNLTFKNTNITNKIKINQGKFNDIFPKGSILLFSIIEKDYNIPYGWVPCDGSYYDVVQTSADKFGKSPDGSYAKFYEKSDNKPQIRNLDLAYEQIIYNPNILQLLNIRSIGFDNYQKITGVKTEPFTKHDLDGLSIWDRDEDFDRPRVYNKFKFEPRTGLSSEPIKRDYIYIRKII